jgi:hypothetical protein
VLDLWQEEEFLMSEKELMRNLVLDLWREEEFPMLEKELVGNPVTLLE